MNRKLSKIYFWKDWHLAKSTAVDLQEQQPYHRWCNYERGILMKILSMTSKYWQYSSRKITAQPRVSPNSCVSHRSTTTMKTIETQYSFQLDREQDEAISHKYISSILPWSTQILVLLAQKWLQTRLQFKCLCVCSTSKEPSIDIEKWRMTDRNQEYQLFPIVKDL